MAEDSFNTFVERVQSLAPELFEHIYNLVFTADSGDKQIDEHYKPPLQLSIDPKSRAAFAKDYFPNTFIGKNTEVINLWLDALPTEHKVLIKEIVDLQDDNSFIVEDPFTVAAHWRAGALHLSVSMEIVEIETDEGYAREGFLWVRQ